MYYVGLDLGKRLDYSAIAVVERKEQEPLFDYLAWMQRQYAEREGLAVRYLERIQLGTPYTQVVERVVKTIERLRRKEKCRLVVDATGMVGKCCGRRGPEQGGTLRMVSGGRMRGTNRQALCHRRFANLNSRNTEIASALAAWTRSRSSHIALP